VGESIKNGSILESMAQNHPAIYKKAQKSKVSFFFHKEFNVPSERR
jgi:hypothetical protein